MVSEDDRKSLQEKLIEDNLKRAFTDKASEEVPEDLLALLAQLKAQDEKPEHE